MSKEENSKVDLFSILASIKKSSHNKIVIQVILLAPKSKNKVVNIVHVVDFKGLITHIFQYLTNRQLPSNEKKAKNVKKLTTKYTLVSR